MRDLSQIKAPEDFANVLDGARIRVGTVTIQNGVMRFEIDTVAGEHCGVEIAATMLIDAGANKATFIADTRLRIKPLA